MRQQLAALACLVAAWPSGTAAPTAPEVSRAAAVSPFGIVTLTIEGTGRSGWWSS